MNSSNKALVLELKKEILGALEPHFVLIDTRLNKIDGRLETVEKHMARHCIEIRKLESTIKSHGKVLKRHGEILNSHSKILGSHSSTLNKLLARS